jgi:hypothetical protein
VKALARRRAGKNEEVKRRREGVGERERKGKLVGKGSRQRGIGNKGRIRWRRKEGRIRGRRKVEKNKMGREA